MKSFFYDQPSLNMSYKEMNVLLARGFDAGGARSFLQVTDALVKAGGPEADVSLPSSAT